MSIPIRPPLIGGYGPKDAKMVLVGEALGVEEVKEGKPFVGQAGWQLNSLLKGAGIPREELYITNVIKEHPPENDITHFINLYASSPMVTNEGMEYLDLLKHELREIKPNIIVALGNIPLYALTGYRGITSRRGVIVPASTLSRDGITPKVMPTLHPSYIQRDPRNYLQRYDVMRDLAHAWEEAKFPEHYITSREYITEPTCYDVLEFIKCNRENKLTYFDIETSKETQQILLISFAFSGNEVLVIPLVNEDSSPYFEIEEEIAVWSAISELLLSDDIIKVGQNVMFDATYLHQLLGTFAQPLECTLVAHAIAYPEFFHRLEYLTTLYTDLPYYKSEGHKFMSEAPGRTWEGFVLYNAKDSIVLPQILEGVKSELYQEGNLDTYKKQTRLHAPLAFMGMHGVKVDVEGRRKESVKALEELRERQKEINKTAGISLNPNSPKQLADFFYIVRGHKPYKKHGKRGEEGAITTDEKALKKLLGKGDNVAELIIKYRKLSKLRGTYLETILDEGRYRFHFNVAGTKFGRPSCRSTPWSTGGNSQNLDPRVRKYLIADDGEFIATLDLQQAENRIVAYIAPEPNMIEAFENGEDIHKRTSQAILKGRGIEKPLNKIVKSERDEGKRGNHGLNYGLGIFTFAHYYEVTYAVAREVLAAVHAEYPGIKANYHSWVRRDVEAKRPLINLFGRTLQCFGRAVGDTLTMAYSFIPQSSIADMMNQLGIYYAYSEREIEKYSKLLNLEHDGMRIALSLDRPMQDNAALLFKIIDNLEQHTLRYGAHRFNIPIDLQVGYNFGEYEKRENERGQVDLEIMKGDGRVENLAVQLETTLNR